MTLASAAETRRPALCTANETPVFSCAIGAKVASLCASRDLSPTAGYLYYAFGKPGAVEVAIPKKTPAFRQSITVGTLSYSKGGGDYVRIRNGKFAYVAYSALGDGWEQEGVAVEQDGKPLSSLACHGAALGPDGWQALYKAKLPADQQGFEKP
ncbi:MAG: hypothetical protein WA840_23780 [Caulobacteraceae bacterium]